MRILLVALCVLPSTALAQTVSDDVLMTAQERAILFVTNEVRNDPAPWPTPFDAGYDTWPCKAGEPENLPPLQWNADLAAAARFHANDMYDNSHFEHASSDGTSFGRRLQRFYEGGGIGENIAWGQSGPVDVLASWMTSPGHRCNILSPDWDELGTGYAGARNGRNPYYVQDFGARRGIERHKMAAGVSYVRSARNSRYGVNWYDPQNSFDEPTIVLVRASGCTDLRLKAGLPHQGTYDYVGEPDGFPEDYWFLAVDAGGDVHAYPQDGALTTPLPMHSDDAIDDRPMPECAAALLAGTDLPGDDTPDDEVEPDIEEPGAGGDVEPPAQQEDLNPDRRPVRGDTGSSGVLGSGRRGRREEGCAQSTGSVPTLPALLQTLLRR